MRMIDLRIPNGRMAFGEVPEHIDQRLQEAVNARIQGDIATCETLLWEAHQLGPRVLPVFFALYKFYFNQQRLNDAERVAVIGLDSAAAQGGFDPDWRRLMPESADWGAMGAPHFYLFTLKALSFITLRRGDLAGAQEKLAKLRNLDPNNNVGWGTVALLAERVASEGE